MKIVDFVACPKTVSCIPELFQGLTKSCICNIFTDQFKCILCSIGDLYVLFILLLICWLTLELYNSSY